MKHFLKFVCIILAISFVTLGGYLESATPTIKISEKDVQRTLDTLTPFSGALSFKLLKASYSIDRLDVNFLPDGYVSLNSVIELKTPIGSGSGEIRVKARPKYVASTGEIFLKDASVTRLNVVHKGHKQSKIGSILKPLNKSVTKFSPAIKASVLDKVSAYVAEKPIYVAKRDSFIYKHFPLKITRILFVKDQWAIKLSWAGNESRLAIYAFVLLLLSLIAVAAFKPDSTDHD